jgi:K+-transporting ATPase KdpF subunit
MPLETAPLDIMLGLALAAGLLVYLLAALIAPERF